MAKYQRRLGHMARVVKRDGFDGLGIGKFYDMVIIGSVSSLTKPYKPISVKRKLYLLFPKPLRKIIFRFASFHRSLKFYLAIRHFAKQFDILHIHSQYKVAFFVPFKKKVFEFHGDDMRCSPRKTQGRLFGEISHILDRLFLILFAGQYTFLVSTPDMLKDVPHSRWMPNPVDTEHFKPQHKPMPSALYTHNWYEDETWAVQWAIKSGIGITILDRARNNVFLYKDMPNFLNSFTHFIDRKKIPSLSKTALEALSCGLKVVTGAGKIVEGLPDCHYPENVACACLQVYEEVLN